MIHIVLKGYYINNTAKNPPYVFSEHNIVHTYVHMSCFGVVEALELSLAPVNSACPARTHQTQKTLFDFQIAYSA